VTLLNTIIEIVEKEQHRRIKKLVEHQQRDGSFRFRFQGSLMTDAFYIITIRALNIETEEENIRLLTKTLRTTQEKEGYWKAYRDEPNGHLSATIIAYTALLYSGHYTKDDKQMKKARSFIIKNAV